MLSVEGTLSRDSCKVTIRPHSERRIGLTRHAKRFGVLALMMIAGSGCATNTVVSEFCLIAPLPPIHRAMDNPATVSWLDEYRAVYDVSCDAL